MKSFQKSWFLYKMRIPLCCFAVVVHLTCSFIQFKATDSYKCSKSLGYLDFSMAVCIEAVAKIRANWLNCHSQCFSTRSLIHRTYSINSIDIWTDSCGQDGEVGDGYNLRLLKQYVFKWLKVWIQNAFKACADRYTDSTCTDIAMNLNKGLISPFSFVNLTKQIDVAFLEFFLWKWLHYVKHTVFCPTGISCAAAMLLCIPRVRCASLTLALILICKLLLNWMYIKSFLMLQGSPLNSLQAVCGCWSM